MEFNGHEIIKIEENVVWKEIDNELVVLNLSNGFYFTLNDTAKTIWYCFDKKKEFNRIIDEIIDKYQVSQKQAIQDLKNIILKLLKDKLITINY